MQVATEVLRKHGRGIGVYLYPLSHQVSFNPGLYLIVAKFHRLEIGALGVQRLVKLSPFVERLVLVIEYQYCRKQGLFKIKCKILDLLHHLTFLYNYHLVAGHHGETPRYLNYGSHSGILTI